MSVNFFNTDKRIKLGIWGLGRGGAFIKLCNDLNIDVVAGCDYNPIIRDEFQKNCPGAVLTDNEDEFLAMDIDAVLIATFFTDHAKHAIKALKAGKHVLSEVTSFFTPAEGVELVEAVEASGKQYMLLENYPFSKQNMYAKKLWDKGFFGDLMYAEYNYVHDCRSLQYTYINSVPVEPGWECHSWRSWVNFHYYCTHSLGPVMYITGRRPVEVYAPECNVHMAGFLPDNGFGCVTPSLIKMDNGGIVRNLMGAVSSDSHDRRLWGTLAAADLSHGFNVTVGASGHGRHFELTPTGDDEVWKLAEKAGHGGGDFWELYFFAREFLTGEKAPWDIYSSSDVTLAGIMAFRSTRTNRPEPVPDFRDKDVRNHYRNDHFHQESFDTKKIFPEGHDTSITKDFTSVMKGFCDFSNVIGFILVRSVFDGMKVASNFSTDSDRIRHINDVRKLIHDLPEIAENYRKARKIMESYPNTKPAVAIRSYLADGYEDKVLDTDNTLKELTEYLITL